jgi:preprotein translocase subunit SecY
MWEKIRVVWQIPELRQKILLTLGLLAIYRLGFQIPLPIVDPLKVQAAASEGGGVTDVLQQVAVFSASQLTQVTIFGLGIMPYISASIIFQLLGSVYPPLEALQKEGEAGRKKINEYTRYATVLICMIQSAVYVRSYIIPRGLVDSAYLNEAGQLGWGWWFVAILTMTAGTAFLMWIGEQIDEFGIGNGISLLIMAGILAAMPGAGFELIKNSSLELGGGPGGKFGVEQLLMLAAMFVAVVVGVVYITLGQRRIPMQSAKHVRGRRVYGGTRQYLPLKVNQSGVMPIIFASSLLMLPMLLFTQLNRIAWEPGSFWARFFGWGAEAFSRDSLAYVLLYIALIYFFWLVHSRISAWQADRRLSGKSHVSYHLCRCRLPGFGGGDSHGNFDVDGSSLRSCQFLWWNRAVDRGERRLRFGAEDRQPFSHAELLGIAGKILETSGRLDLPYNPCAAPRVG